MRKHKKQRHQRNLKNSSNIRPPFFINRNQRFDLVRKQMTMKADGPTINEISSIDTTGSLGKEDTPRIADTRPVNTSTQIKNWFENKRQIILSVVAGVITAIVLYILGSLVHNHDIHLTEHDKDIQYLQKNDTKQDGEIEQIKDKTQEISTDVRLIEQRVELTSGNSVNSKKKK